MPALCIGLMSGTSVDGVDAALCRFEDGRFQDIVSCAVHPYPDALRRQILDLQQHSPALPMADLARLDNAIGEQFAIAAKAVLTDAGAAPSEIAVIGSHGQTVFHDPEHVGSSVQLGNAALIAARTGITTVADFRRADIARGGHGAPLVPAFHHALFAAAGETRCIVNIGGIANITVLPDTDTAAVRGFDTGPGNALMDDWADMHLGEPYDANGRLAAAGRVVPQLLASLLDDPYFAKSAPKSTGRDAFNLRWAQQRYPGLGQLHAADVQRTFCELTVRTIADALRQQAPATSRLLPCGGGSLNPFLLERLQAAVGDVRVEMPDRYGIDASWVEAAAFAWLAWRSLHGQTGNLPGVTGASEACVLGAIYR